MTGTPTTATNPSRRKAGTWARMPPSATPRHPSTKSKRWLAGWPDWGPAQIEERRGQLLGWAKERWGVDFSGIADPTPDEELPDDEQEEDADVKEGEVQAAA